MQPRSAAQLLIPLVLLAAPVAAQVDGAYQNREEREIFSTGPGGDSGTILDAANPMDLINRLRQSEAMKDATPPADAIDAALMDFHQGAR